MSTQKATPEDTKVKYVSQNTPAPSAPPMELYVGPEAPPSYDQAVAGSNEVVPTPYYVPLQDGKGCVLMLQFPCHDANSVGNCFKGNVPNTLLHGGKVVAFIPEMQFFPSHKTSAVIIHFGAERTALSWLQNMTSSNPELTSRWLGMIAENKVVAKLPNKHTQYKAVSIVLMQHKSEFVESKASAQEYSQLMKDVLSPAKKRHAVANIVASKPIFACGDWSSFQAKASELILSISLFLSFDHRAAYLQEFTSDPKLKRFRELSNLKNKFLFTSGFSTGDVWKFQDL